MWVSDGGRGICVGEGTGVGDVARLHMRLVSVVELPFLILHSLGLLPLATPAFIQYSLVPGASPWHTSLSDVHTVHYGTHTLSPVYINPCTFIAQTLVILTH